jgi:hypothetical protein
MLGREGNRGFQLEREHGFGRDHRGSSARQEHAGYTRYRTGPSANRGTLSAGGSRANSCADPGCASDRYSVSPARRTTRSLQQLGLNGQLLAVDQSEMCQLDSQLGHSFDATCLFGYRNMTQHSLASPRHHPTVNHQRLLQFRVEAIARHVSIAGQELRDSYTNHGARLQSQPRWQ